MDKKLDSDPTGQQTSEEIELKRAELHILFFNKVERWLARYSKKGTKRDFMIGAQRVLSGQIEKVTMGMIEPLERMLHKNFSTEEQVDLCSDDDEVQVVSVECGPIEDKSLRQTRHVDIAEISAAIIIDDSEDEIQVQDSNLALKDAPAPWFEMITPPVNVPEIPAQTLEVPQKPNPYLEVLRTSQSTCGASISSAPTIVSQIPAQIIKIPLPASDVLPLESLDLTKQTRKFANSRPSSSKDLPFTADYRLKTPNLQPSSIYAKSAEEFPRVRNVFSVPHMNPVVQTNNSAAYDPLKVIQKLEHIKEKIYAKNYLKLDVAHKIEMQKKHEEEQRAKEEVAKEPSDTSEEETPQAKRLQKSKIKPGFKRRRSAEKINAQSPRKRGRPRKQESKSLPPQSHQKSNRKVAPKKKKAVPVFKRVAKKKKQTVSFDTTDDEDYVVPSHVLDPVDTELDEGSLNTTTTTATTNLEDDLIQILGAKLPLPIDSKNEEADTSPIVEQSFDEDNLLVEIEVNDEKNIKSRRTRYVAPKKRMRGASAMSQHLGRKRPRKAAGNQVHIKEEPISSD